MEAESALDDQNWIDHTEMDQIARMADHQYYLRSLKQPGHSRGRKTLLTFSFISVVANATGAEQGNEEEQQQLLERQPLTEEQSYDPVPHPALPPPPDPKGNSAGDYYEALNQRDKDMRKG